MNNQKGIAPLAIIIIIGITVVAAFYLGKGFKNGIPAANSVPQASSPSAKEDGATLQNTTSDLTANWKKYTNTKYGYSVKYPSNLNVEEDDTYYHLVNFTLPKNNNGSANLPPFYTAVINQQYTAKNAASVNFMSADWINGFINMKVGDTRKSSSITFEKLANITVAGQNGIRIKVTAAGADQERVFLQKNGNYYMIASYYKNDDFEKFLQSFNFIQIGTSVPFYNVKAEMVCSGSDDSYRTGNHVDFNYTFTAGSEEDINKSPNVITLTDTKTNTTFEMGRSIGMSRGAFMHSSVQNKDKLIMPFVADGRVYILKQYKLSTLEQVITKDLQPVVQTSVSQVCNF